MTAAGQPSSWSAGLDALAAGRSVLADEDGLVFPDEADYAAKRLFVVSAGNVRGSAARLIGAGRRGRALAVLGRTLSRFAIRR
ncbi:hypothetical protein AB0J55_43910 [Amycolatopsis sp. NPDC049688]|uniref:hypothetical protein n=1 Tax=Amycolatopsis sp. NPDC049688 TaxID=3154733 RepID=UPI00342126F8